MLDFEIKQEIMPVIQINFEEIKEALTRTMEQYTGMIVTEESLSACKAEQKQLAGIRTKIDNYRKDKKKEMSKPITDFENQCKELISLIEKAESPIKEGIKVFDDKKREEKKQKALEIIQQVVKAHDLKPKFAEKLIVIDKYMNLSSTTKSVKEDIEQRAFYLVEEQSKEEEKIQTIKTTIENENKSIKTQIKYEDFENLLNIGYPVPQIIQRINQMAEKIRLAEKPPAPVLVVEATPVIPQEKELPQVRPEPIREDLPLYFVNFKITGTKYQTALLGEFLRANNIKYEVIEKGAVEQ